MAEPNPSTRVAEPWAERARALLGTGIWLVFLIGPVLSLPEVEPVAPAVAGLAVFVVGYIVVAWSCWDTPLAGGRPTVARIAGLVLFSALGVALAAGYGDDNASWRLVLVYVGAIGAAMLPAPRATNAWLAGTVAALLVIAAAQDANPADVAVLALVVVLAGVLNVAFRRMSELITHLRNTRAELADTAVRAERLRFSRDLHDLLGHTLSLIVVKSELVRRSVRADPDRAIDGAAEIEQVGRRALSDVRDAVTGYRERAFAGELDAARAALADAGLRVTVRTSGTPLPAPADSLFGWVVREATTNVVRHSDARTCEIEVRRSDGHATLEIRDDGRGGASDETAPAAGSGLGGLAERLSEVGGRLDAGRSDFGGWRVTATVPVETS